MWIWRRWCFIGLNILLIVWFSFASRLWTRWVGFVNFFLETPTVKFIFFILIQPILGECSWKSSRLACVRKSLFLVFTLFSNGRKWSVRILLWLEGLVVMGGASSQTIQSLRARVWGLLDDFSLWYRCIATFYGTSTVAISFNRAKFCLSWLGMIGHRLIRMIIDKLVCYSIGVWSYSFWHFEAMHILFERGSMHITLLVFVLLKLFSDGLTFELTDQWPCFWDLVLH